VTTKEIYATRILKAQQGGSVITHRKLDPREIYEALETARNFVMQEILDNGGILDGEFVTQFANIPILDDPKTAQKYSILPTKLISFSQMEGLQQVSPMKNQSESFIRISSSSQNIYGPLESSKIGGRTGYYIERVKIGTDRSIRIYYKGCASEYKDVLIKMIASTYDFDEDETLPIPAAYEDRIFQMMLQTLGVQISVPIDTKVDLQPPA